MLHIFGRVYKWIIVPVVYILSGMVPQRSPALTRGSSLNFVIYSDLGTTSHSSVHLAVVFNALQSTLIITHQNGRYSPFAVCIY